MSLINVAVAVAIVARDRSSFADKPCCVMNGSSTIAPKTRRTEEFRPEQSFIVWILSRLDIKSDLLSSLLPNLLSSLLSILGSPWATLGSPWVDWSGLGRVLVGLCTGIVRNGLVWFCGNVHKCLLRIKLLADDRSGKSMLVPERIEIAQPCA